MGTELKTTYINCSPPQHPLFIDVEIDREIKNICKKVFFFVFNRSCKLQNYVTILNLI